MGSWIMLSIGLWDQIYPNIHVPNYSFVPNIRLNTLTYQSDIVTSLSMYNSDHIMRYFHLLDIFLETSS
jgi:hypothetical protein